MLLSHNFTEKAKLKITRLHYFKAQKILIKADLKESLTFFETKRNLYIQ